MKIVCIGDSLTTGYGVFKNERWSDILIDEYGFNIINKGINGDTTSGMLDRFSCDVINNFPTHVFIMGGCNDLLSGRKLANIEKNIEKMANEAIENNIAPVISSEVPVIPEIARRKWSFDADYDYVIENEILYREWILEFSKKNKIHCVDLYGIFEEKLKFENAKKLYIDGLHPTKQGHRLIAESLANLFKSL